MADSSSIRQSIYNNQRRIDVFEDEIAQLYRDISKLEEISRNILQSKQKLSITQSRHLSMVSAISTIAINDRITSPYCEGMKQTLTGSRYQDALEGLIIADRKVNEKIYELQEEIRQKRLQIDNVQNVISGLRHELYYAMNE